MGVRITTFFFYSTVADCVINEVNIDNLFNTKDLTEVIIKFDVSVKSSKLTKTYHYTSQQQQLYEVVKELYEVKGYGYRRISHYLINNGFRTIRSNKPILQNFVYSIYKKGKIREERINRDFDYYINNIHFFKN